jgi:hypothetical protein
MRIRWTGFRVLVAAIAVVWAASIQRTGAAAGRGRRRPQPAARQATRLRRRTSPPAAHARTRRPAESEWDLAGDEQRELGRRGAQREAGPHTELMGAWGAEPGGMGIVEGGTIPYKPEALKKKQDNFKNRMLVKVTNDPHASIPAIPSCSASARCPARQLHAVPVSDFPEPRPDPDGLRIQGRDAHGVHGQASGRAGRLLDGMVQRPLGRRHAGHRRDWLQRSSVARLARATSSATRRMSSNAGRPRGAIT